MAQPDISSILAALAQQQPSGTPQAATPMQQPPSHPPPHAYSAQPPSAPPTQAPYLPQPSHSGSVDLSAIRPVNSGSVSIQDAIAKAKSIAESRGMSSWSPSQAQEREDPRLAGRGGYRHSRSRSRSPSRRDAYSANNPYRDERREDPRRAGSYRRSPSAERNLRGSRDPAPGFRSNDTETETIRIKSALVGLVIGRNGENLRRIESETGARVQFIQAKGSNVVEREATISGSLRSRENAKNAIFGIIEENGGTNIPQDKGAYTAGMPGRAKVNLPALRDGENSVQVMVPDKTVGLIIGRGGETIKELQEKSGCHVNIVGENKSVNGLRPVNLIGNDRSTAYAKELILEIVESDSNGSNSRGGAGGGASGGASSNAVQATRDRGFGNAGGFSKGSGQGDTVTKTIQVPSEAVGMIIGKGGETIKQMQRDSGCKINVNQPQGSDVTRAIDLEGSAAAMRAAEDRIWEKVETVKQRDAAAGRSGRGGGNDNAGGYGGYSQQQPQAPPAMPGYGAYMPPQPQAPPSMPAFQMPSMPVATPQPDQQQQPQQQFDPQQAAAYAQWYAQIMGQYGGQGAPGTQ